MKGSKKHCTPDARIHTDRNNHAVEAMDNSARALTRTQSPSHTHVAHTMHSNVVQWHQSNFAGRTEARAHARTAEAAAGATAEAQAEA
jgi:hypothetical protein